MIKETQDRGCGEILITSVDHEGTEKGFDIDLIENIKDHIYRPLIVSGGCGSIDDIIIFKIIFKMFRLQLLQCFIMKSKNFKNKTEIKFMIKISILDYGMGNIESLKNAIKKLDIIQPFSAKKI